MASNLSRRKFVQNAGLTSIALGLSPELIKAQANAIKDKVEITKADFQKEIDSYNAKILKREDELNTCKGSNLPMKVSIPI